MNNAHPDRQDDDVEYFGAPTEYADAQEVPEWVALAAKILFFLPGAFVTAATIPIIVLGLLLACLVVCVILAATL